jgi:hypothetical protein
MSNSEVKVEQGRIAVQPQSGPHCYFGRCPDLRRSVCGAAALNWQKLLLYESKALSAGAQQYNRQIIINLDVVVNQSRFKDPFGRPIQLGFLLVWVPVRRYVTLPANAKSPPERGLDNGICLKSADLAYIHHQSKSVRV